MSSPRRWARDPRNHLLWPTLSDALAQARDDQTAILGGSRALNYRELATVVARGACELDERFPPGARLLIGARDQLVTALSFLAALGSHCIPLLVDPLAPRWLRRLSKRWSVAGALGERALLEPLELPVIDEGDVLAWLGDRTTPGEPPAVRNDEPAFWTFTSGTTGEPRAIVHGHRGPAAAFAGFAKEVLALGACDRTISTAGLPFVYALGNNLMFPLMAGAAAILPPDLLLPTVLAELSRHRATVLVSGPWSLAAIARLAARTRWSPALPRLRLVLSAGESLPGAVFARWQRSVGQTIVENFGCTEMFNSFLSNSPDDAQPGSLGRVVPGFEIRVGGAAPRPHARGPLAVRGDSRALGISREDGSPHIDSTPGEWWETGDEVSVDASGRIVYQGRLDDRFKVRGQFVHPVEVERSVLEMDGIEECMVAPDEGEDGLVGIRILIVAETGRDGEELRHRLSGHLRSSLGTHFRTSRVELVEALPRTERGKLKRTRAMGAS